MRRLVLSILALAGCSDRAAIGLDAPPATVDAVPDAGPGCTSCDWLDDYQRRIVNQLAGGAEIAAGVTLTRRVSVAERDAVRTYLLAELAALGLTAELHAYAGGTPGTTGANVVATLLSWDGDGDRAVELWSPSPALETLYRAHGPAANTPIQPVTFAHSDHQAFLEAGFPATGIGEEFVGGDHTPHYHEATDTVESVSFAHLAVVTHLALAVLAADATAL